MSQIRRLFRAGVCWGAAILFALVALPLVAVAAIVLRPVLLVGAVGAGLSVAVLYCVSGRFRGWVGRRLGWLDGVPVTAPIRH